MPRHVAPPHLPDELRPLPHVRRFRRVRRLIRRDPGCVLRALPRNLGRCVLASRFIRAVRSALEATVPADLADKLMTAASGGGTDGT